MKVRTKIKAGRLSANHNQTAGGLRVKTRVKAGRLAANHNQTVRKA